jgi:ELWxxDGT repeat protein
MKRYAFFTANDGVHGNEPWVTDGTPGGTHMLLDVNPGPASGVDKWFQVDFGAAADGHYVFTADDGQHGPELWVTDGTAAGTHLLLDIWPGSMGSAPYNVSLPLGFATLGDGRLVVGADDGVHGREPWVTDGTKAGTFMLADIRPGGEGGDPQQVTPLGDGRVVFLAPDGVHGYEPWVTDGTLEGTHLVGDITPGPGPGGAIFPGVASLGDGRMIFSYDDGVHGQEPWVTDGTEAGTFLLWDIAPGEGPTHSRYGPGPNAPLSSSPGEFAALSTGLAAFSAYTPGVGLKPWITDGTPTGTHPLVEVAPGGSGLFGIGYTPLSDGSFVFGADNALWISDGTSDGTHWYFDLLFGFYDNFAALGCGRVVFSANDAEGVPAPWVTDGTAEGTFQLAEVRSRGDYPSFGAGNGFTPLGDGRAVFAGEDTEHGVEPWITDGTIAGTYLIADIAPGSSLPDSFFAAG